MLYIKSPGCVSHCRVSGLHLNILVEAASVNPKPYIHRYTTVASLSVEGVDSDVWDITGAAPHRLTVKFGRIQSTTWDINQILWNLGYAWGVLLPAILAVNCVLSCDMNFVLSISKFLVNPLTLSSSLENMWVYHKVSCSEQNTAVLERDTPFVLDTLTGMRYFVPSTIR